MTPGNGPREPRDRVTGAVGRLRIVGTRLATSAAVGLAVWAGASAGRGRAGDAALHGTCFSALRLLRHAVAAFETQHGALPGRLPGASGPADQGLLARQLLEPRDAAGTPAPFGPFTGLLAAIPVNPYTGRADLVLVPPGADAAAFAATSQCGWAYLAEPGRDGTGPLPAGLLFPCGDNGGRPPDRRLASVQEIAFEIEDFERWR